MIKINLQSIKTVIIIILVILLFIFAGLYSHKAYEAKQQNINISALTDSIVIQKDKLGREVSSKNILLADLKSLETLNKSLYDEIKNGKQKDLAQINKLNIVIDNLQDSVKILNGGLVKHDGMTYMYEFGDSTQFRNFKSQISFVSTQQPDSVLFKILKDQILADVIIKQYVNNDKINLQVYSNNPCLQINNIEGSIIDLSRFKTIEKKKRWNVCAFAGIGFGFGYTLTNSGGGFGVCLGPQIGIGISYSLINF